jgi:hypothetical protein
MLGPQPEGPPASHDQLDVIVDDRDLIRLLVLDCTEAERDAFIATIPHIDVNPLRISYPTDQAWVAESDKAKEQWMAEWFDKDGKPKKTADSRTKKTIRDRLATTVVDRSKLKVVKASESVIFVDPNRPQPEV